MESGGGGEEGKEKRQLASSNACCYYYIKTSTSFGYFLQLNLLSLLETPIKRHDTHNDSLDMDIISPTDMDTVTSFDGKLDDWDIQEQHKT